MTKTPRSSLTSSCVILGTWNSMRDVRVAMPSFVPDYLL
jgi:hypothetical protein